MARNKKNQTLICIILAVMAILTISIGFIKDNNAEKQNDINAKGKNNTKSADTSKKEEENIDVGTKSAFDTFNHDDTKEMITSEDGQTYLTAGDNKSTTFKVVDKKAVQTGLGNGYMSLDAGSTIKTIGAEWTLEQGENESTVAIVITNDKGLELANLLHFITTSKDWNLQIRKGGKDNKLVNVANGTYKTPLNADGKTVYHFEMSVDKDNKKVYMKLPDGTNATYIGDDIPVVTGSRGYWQAIRRNENEKEPRFTNIWLNK